jgi:two-component system, OmpR family, sensor kinase
MRQEMALRTRLLITLLLIVVGVSTIFSIIVYQWTSLTLAHEFLEDLHHRADLIATNIQLYPQVLDYLSAPQSLAANTDVITRLFETPDVYLQLDLPDQKVLAHSSNLTGFILSLPTTSGSSSHLANTSVGQIPVLLYDEAITIGSKVRAYILVARSSSVLSQQLDPLKNILFLIAPAEILLTSLFVWLSVGKAMKPLEMLDTKAASIAETRDHALRLPVSAASREISRLTSTINHMLEALEETYRQLQTTNERQRMFLVDVSHELRTPLTVMLTSLDLIKKIGECDAAFQQNMLADIQAEAERMSRLVSQLLLLSRSEMGQTHDAKPLFLAEVVKEACRQIADTYPIPLDYHEVAAIDDVLICGNADYLKQSILILLENAFKYTPLNGNVTVKSEASDNHVSIAVCDTGIGIAPEDLPLIFERFYRAKNVAAYPGTGLGLAIARHLVALHHGSLDVQSTQGLGSTFTIWLPVMEQWAAEERDRE